LKDLISIWLIVSFKIAFLLIYLVFLELMNLLYIKCFGMQYKKQGFALFCLVVSRTEKNKKILWA